MKTYEIISNDGKVIREVQGNYIDTHPVNRRLCIYEHIDGLGIRDKIVAYLSDNVTCIEKAEMSPLGNITFSQKMSEEDYNKFINSKSETEKEMAETRFTVPENGEYVTHIVINKIDD